MCSQILRNVESSSSVQPHFLEFLLSLGWPVDVGRHPGWTGHLDTSWSLNSCSESNDVQQTGKQKKVESKCSCRLLFACLEFMVTASLLNFLSHFRRSFYSRGHWRRCVQRGEKGFVLCGCSDRNSLRGAIVDRKLWSAFVPIWLWTDVVYYKPSLWGILGLTKLFCCFPEESSVHSDSTVEADTNTELMPASLKQHNLTLELFPNHSENLESSKKVKPDSCTFIWLPRGFGWYL